MYKNSIRVCHWNVGGIFTHGENKLNDKLFLKEVQNHDLIILSETHVGYNTDLHTSMQGYIIKWEILWWNWYIS